ncbi:hypothetical protein [Inediibacterium massiliense]|uniref:hypothetical protein n=1 Tax=Inediibacterium massiliense TaxID=1658111 RepID=UPI0006B40CBD|nr:hypothetical protein [Inediibacterium massiliense]
MEIQDAFQTWMQTILNINNFYTISNSIMVISTIIVWARLAFFIFVIFYVYEDAPKYSMNKFVWLAIVIFVPKHIGFMTYVVIRTIKQHFPKENKFSVEHSINISNENSTMNKNLFYKVISVWIMITILVTAIYMVDKEKIKSEENIEFGVIREENSFKDEYKDFSGKEVKEIWFGENGILEIHYDSKVKKGELILGVYEYNGEPIETFKTNKRGVTTISIEKNRIYKLIAEGSDTKGYYRFSWEFNKEE